MSSRQFAPQRALGRTGFVATARRAIAARQDKGPCWWNPDPEA